MNRPRIIISLLALTMSLSLGAQSFQESLFLNNYRLGFRYNPAMASECNFLSVGEFSTYSANNVGASAFLFPQEDGSLVTGLHSAVSADTFMGVLKDVNRTQSHVNYSLFSFGFHAGGAFHTIEVSARGMYGLSVPKDYFRLLKLGGEDVFSLTDTRLQGRLYTELAYGYSRKIGDHLRLGARGKLLLGLYAADYRYTRYNLTVSSDSYLMEIESQLDLTNHSGKMSQNEDGYLNLLDWKVKDKWSIPSGGGLAVDLGLVWEPVDGLQLAASVVDLGGLFWYYGNAGRSEGTATITGVKGMNYDDLNLAGLIDQAKIIGKELIDPIALKAVDRRVAFYMLPFQVNAGIRYSMPFYKPLSLGVTGNYASYESLPYWDARFALAVNPLNWLDITGNIGWSSYGLTWGAAAQVRIYRFRLHAGMQNGFGGTVPYTSMPLKANAKTLVVGLTFDL